MKQATQQSTFVLMTDSQNAVDVLVGSNEDGLPEWPQFTGDSTTLIS